MSGPTDNPTEDGPGFVARGRPDPREERSQACGLIEGAIARIIRSAGPEPYPAEIREALWHLNEALRRVTAVQS